MYQIFDDVSSPAASGERVKALQRELKSRKLKGFLVPHSDEHQNEFLPPSAERLAWLTGFTGSAGVAVVLDKAAALFVDGRYILQARAQTDPTLFEVLQTPEAKASSWIADKLAKGAAVGYDPALHTIKEIERLTETLAKSGIKLSPGRDQSDRRSLAGPAEAVAAPRSCRTASNMPGAARKTRSATCRRSSRTRSPTRCCSPCSIRSPGCSTSGAATSSTRRSRSPSPSCRRAARPTLFIDPAKVGDNVKGELREFVDLAEPAALTEKLKALGEAQAPASGSIPTRRRSGSRKR